MNYLSIDVGTTACKCQLFNESGDIKEYIIKEYALKNAEGYACVDIAAIKENVFSMIRAVAEKYLIGSVCISTFGETFVALDKNGQVLFDPLLYTDKRGELQAKEISALFGNAYVFRVTGTIPHAMYSASKLLWVKENRPKLYKKIDKVMLMCDYLGYLLTGKRVIDYALAARTGIFDITRLQFSAEMCERLGIERTWFSSPRRAGSVVGKIINNELALKDCTLVLGSHDQVCTALGAGITEAGHAVDGMGTVECITAVYRGAKDNVKMGEQGYTCIPYAIEGLYCSYIVNYSSGSIVNWFKNELLHGYKGGEKRVFAYLEKGMSDEPTGLFVLPYFTGAMIPYQDIGAKGAIVGLTTATTDSQIYRAIMEGLSMEMCFETATAEVYGIKIGEAVATGGGANSEKWLQLKADIQNIPYKTLRSSEGGLCGCAVLQSVAFGSSYTEAVKTFVKIGKKFIPDKARTKAYVPYYNKYKGLYNSLKKFNCIDDLEDCNNEKNS